MQSRMQNTSNRASHLNEGPLLMLYRHRGVMYFVQGHTAMAGNVTQDQSARLACTRPWTQSWGGGVGLRYDLMDQGHCISYFSIAMCYDNDKTQ